MFCLSIANFSLESASDASRADTNLRAALAIPRAVIREHVLPDDVYFEKLIRPAAFAEDICLTGAALYAKLQLDETPLGNGKED